ncbi:MAG: sigma-70 family RNA polymerase sigma factor [Salinivirgaceae bacterium]
MRLLKNNKPTNKSDEELLKSYLKTGNMEALGELYNRYLHLVYGVCLKYFADGDKSQDAVIDIFEKLVIDVERFEIKNVKSWLYVITKNHCLMALRKENTNRKRNEKYLSSEIMESTTQLHPIDEPDALDKEKRLLDCIEKLKTEQRKCISLFYFDSKCYKEIAQTLKTSEQKVKSGIQNGKRNLKNCIEHEKA